MTWVDGGGKTVLASDEPSPLLAIYDGAEGGQVGTVLLATIVSVRGVLLVASISSRVNTLTDTAFRSRRANASGLVDTTDGLFRNWHDDASFGARHHVGELEHEPPSAPGTT